MDAERYVGNTKRPYSTNKRPLVQTYTRNTEQKHGLVRSTNSACFTRQTFLTETCLLLRICTKTCVLPSVPYLVFRYSCIPIPEVHIQIFLTLPKTCTAGGGSPWSRARVVGEVNLTVYGGIALPEGGLFVR